MKNKIIKFSQNILLFISVVGCTLTTNFVPQKTTAQITKNSLTLTSPSHIVKNTSLIAKRERISQRRTLRQRSPRKFSFALVADLPYGDLQVSKFENVIREINHDRDVDFVMHAGDIKAGSETCDNNRIMARLRQFQKFNEAFIYTPGDNEWTDCHRVNNGSFNPIERLEFVRKVFFPNPGYSLGQRPIKLFNQSSVSSFEKYVENVLFERHNVVFSTIHVVGSNNNLATWNGIDPNDSIDNPRSDRIAEFKERLKAALNWLEYTFEYANDYDAKGVFVMIHGNPRFELAEDNQGRAGFNDFLARLRELTQQYKKPVVLAHGDSHFYFIDKPFDTDGKTPPLLNFTRIQAFGSPRVHWVKVNVDSKSSHVFSFEQKIVPENIR
ncbi:MAG: metallophosphoesterase [Nostocaceae cyanobacterium]|nr:metallophosphoesterase [Nostocaceae cyanobacterium]